MLRHPLLPWLLFLAAAAAFAVTLWQPDGVALRLGLNERVDARRHALWRDRLHAHHRRLDANVPAGATLFFGASTVQGLAAAGVRACHANFGIGGETAAELARRLPDYRSPGRAAAIVVMTGLNDVLRGDDDGLGESYRRVLAALPADRPVIMSSLPRLPPGGEAGMSRVAAVTRANSLARAACAARRNCRFVDLHEEMSRPAALTEPDGVHLNPAGYVLWSRLLREALAAAGVPEEPCPNSNGG